MGATSVSKSIEYTSPVGSSVLQRQQKERTKATNAQTEATVTVNRAFAHVTKVIPANHANNKPCWFKFEPQPCRTKERSSQQQSYIYIYALRQQEILYINRHNSLNI